MTSSDTPRLLSINEAASQLGLSISWLNRARMNGTGPDYLKLGARIAYAQADLDAWLEGQKHRSTAEYTEARS